MKFPRQLVRVWLLFQWLLARLGGIDKIAGCACTFIQPVLVTCGVSLISLVAHVYFTSIIPKVVLKNGIHLAVIHACLGIWLVFNTFFNYFMCVRTSPGCTTEIDAQVLQEAATWEWTFCSKCNRPKPPLAHHCRICGRCVMKMDHHCPWMANCVGWANYRYFFLMVLHLCLAAAYYCMMAVLSAPPMPWLTFLDELPFFDVLSFFLSGAVSLVLLGFLVWHSILVCSGIGTIDFMMTWTDGESPWQHPYNVGWVRNWQNTFDATGRFWWLTWCLPRWKKKAGCGYCLPHDARREHTGAV